MAKAGTVWVEVRGDNTRLKSDIAGAVTGGLDAGMKAASGAMAQRSQALGAVTAAMLGFTGFGALVVSETREFNKQMSGVGAVADATASDLGNLREAALEAGKATTFTASEAAIAQTELARAGMSVVDILSGGLTGALDLAAAGQLDLGFAAMTTSQALNTFQLDASQATHVADVLAAGANKSAADVSSLSQAMSQVGVVAQQTGLGLEDTVGVLAMFADNAIMGSDAGTSLKTMLQRLVPHSKEAAEQMEKLGLSFYDDGKFVGIEEVAGRLQAAFANLNEEQRSLAMTTMFGTDAVRAASLLYQEGADGVREYTQAVHDQGAAQRMASALLDNLDGDLEALSGSWETLMISLGTAADSGLRTVIQALDKGVDALSEFVSAGDLGAMFSGGLANAGEGIARFIGEAVDAIEGLPESEAIEFLTKMHDLVEGLEVPIMGVATALMSMGAQGLPGLNAIVPALNPLHAALFGVVLQSEAGRDALGELGTVAANAAQVAAGPLGLLADVLGLVADQGWLVQAAMYGFVGMKVASAITPMAKSAYEFASGLGQIAAQIPAIAATRGVSQFEALKGVIGSSTTAVGGLTAALGPAALGMAIGGAIKLYGDWAAAQRAVKQDTEDLTAALLEQMDVSAQAAAAQKLREILDDDSGARDGFREAFDKTGLAIADVTEAITNASGEMDRFRKAYQDSGEEQDSFLRNNDLADFDEGVAAIIQRLFNLRDAGVITEREMELVINAMTDLDKAVVGSTKSFDAMVSQFAKAAEDTRLTAEAQELLNTALDKTAGMDARRKALNTLTAQYEDVARAAGFTSSEIGSLDDKTRGASSSMDSGAASADAFASALSAVGDSAGAAASQVLGLWDAQDSLADANLRVQEAQERLTEILSGNTTAVQNAREALADAQAALDKARSETGPGSKAARSAEKELRDALRELRQAQIEAGKEARVGDWREDQTDRINDALDRVKDAQEKLAEINSGTSDQVVAAQERVAKAQKRLAEETAKTGPKSREAAAAQRDLDRAQRDVVTSAFNVSAATRKMADVDFPAAIREIQKLGEQNLLTKDQVDQMTGALMLQAAALQGVRDENEKLKDSMREEVQVRPGLLNADRQQPGRVASTTPVGGRVRQLGSDRAGGGPVYGNMVHRVNEYDPEMFVDPAGRQYLMPPPGGGQVVPLGQVTAASGSDLYATEVVSLLRELLSEERQLRGELVTTVREIVRAGNGAAIEEALRRLVAQTKAPGRSMAEVRQGQVMFG